MHSSTQHEVHLVVDGIVYGFQRHGGINTMFSELLPRLAAMPGMRVEIFVPPGHIGDLPPWPVARLRRTWFLGKTGLSWKLDRLFEIANEVVRNWRVRSRPRSVFHSTFFTNIDAHLPQVATILDMNHEKLADFPLYRSRWGQDLRETYRDHVTRGTRIIAISQSTKNDAVHYYDLDPDRIDVVHLAVDTGDFWPDKDPSRLPAALRAANPELPYLLYVGWRGEYKNFDRLLKAFAASAFRKRGLLAVVGGALTTKELHEIEGLGLGSHVVSVVHPSTDQLRVLYSCAAAFVFPSYGEGFGIPVLESMACGAPALLADIPVFHEVGGDAAVYFNPFDSTDMAHCIDTYTDPSRRVRLFDAGSRRIACFSWDNSARKMAAVYKKTLEEKAR